jgi:hypothetical protein
MRKPPNETAGLNDSDSYRHPGPFPGAMVMRIGQACSLAKAGDQGHARFRLRLSTLASARERGFAAERAHG